jgi:lipopolysaccharide/colanic/teichoic acid biosynthesis glycosyltransferase
MVTTLPYVRLSRLVYFTMVKRMLDIVLSVLLLLILTPALLVAALAIRLDSPGPVLFIQSRAGRSGKPFDLYKFRTMHEHHGGSLVWFEDRNGSMYHKISNDPRVTRVGRWLRRTSLDEAPQLVNIIKGDMSLIGPRPELVEIVAHYEPWQHDRHLVRPGLTGWWQVCGRGDKPMHEHTELDLYYIRHQSFRLDVLIALRTVRVVVGGRGAY